MMKKEEFDCSINGVEYKQIVRFDASGNVFDWMIKPKTDTVRDLSTPHASGLHVFADGSIPPHWDHYYHGIKLDPAIRISIPMYEFTISENIRIIDPESLEVV